MKIAIFTDTFLPSVDGIVTATLTLAKGLANRGHKIIIVAPKYKKNFNFKYKNIEVVRISSMSAFFHPSFRTTSPINARLLAKLRKEKIDVVHIQTPWTVGLEGILISKVLKKPLVGTYHTYVADKDYLKNVNMDYRVVENFMWKYSLFYYNRCDVVTCPSDFTKGELEDNGCRTRVLGISNGVDPSSFSEGKVDFKKKYNCKGPLLLSVGRISVEKNLRHMLLAFREILKRIPDAKLMIVGDGPYFGQLKDEVRGLGLSRSVILMGGISHDKLKRSGIYAASDLFLITSKTETGPITVLESYANGVPVVGVRAKNLGYIINDGISGIVVDYENSKNFADAVVKVLENQELYSKLVYGCVNELKKHDVKNILDRWEEIYDEVIELNNKREGIVRRARGKVRRVGEKAKNGIGKVRTKFYGEKNKFL